MTRVLITGDRHWGEVRRSGDVITTPQFNPAKLVYKALKRLTPGEDMVVEGEAAGADIMVRTICQLRDIFVTPVPADWCSWEKPCNKIHTHHGTRAGMLRNDEMLFWNDPSKSTVWPDQVWAFHENLTQSKGTIGMVRKAWTKGVPVLWFSPKTPNGAPIKDMGDVSRILSAGSVILDIEDD